MAAVLLTTLEFGSSGNARPHLGKGWSHDEPQLVWAIGQESRLSLATPVVKGSYLLELKIRPYVSPPAVTAQRLTIKVNGEELTSRTLASRGVVQCEIPARVAAMSDSLDIVFRHPDAAKPSELNGTSDDRRLAFAFEQCSLSMSLEGIPPLDSDYFVPPNVLLFDGSTNAVEFRATGEGFTRGYLIQRARLQPGERVLDLGSGNGQKARVLAYYLDATGSYVGLDIVRAGVEWCRQRYAIFPNFRFEMADVYSSHYNPTGRYLDTEYRLPFPDDDFDLVFLSSVFTHMLPEGVAHYIAEISRLLKRGGRCVSTFFLLNRDSLSRIRAGASSLAFANEYGSYWVLDPTNPSKAVALDEEWVRQRFAAAGLRVVEAAYGTWCGGRDLMAAYQDSLISVKE
jgi:SAM-dependent methyltransferase